MKPEQEWEESRIGAGTSIKTRSGWLLFYLLMERHRDILSALLLKVFTALDHGVSDDDWLLCVF